MANQYVRRYRQRHKEAGLCKYCSRQTIHGLLLCAQHRQQAAWESAAYYRAHAEQLKFRWKERYYAWKAARQCAVCGTPLVEGENVVCVNCNMAATLRNQGRV